jgi:hypothetical protein
MEDFMNWLEYEDLEDQRDAAIARIAELKAERDAALVAIRLAYDEGYRAGQGAMQ